VAGCAPGKNARLNLNPDENASEIQTPPMTLLDLTLPSPAENLALEETLLDAAETGAGEEVLRFWESATHFVVVGYANKVAAEVNVAACEARSIPILRRCSGGGTVVQGPGCLNYAVVLRITETGPTRSISTANEYVMEHTRRAIAALSPQVSTLNLSVRGHTDLTLGDLKFSGNAQRRRKNFLLFHGTLLLNFNLPLISQVLNMPSLQPDYRDGRAHEQFIMNLSLSAAIVKQALAAEWQTTETLRRPPEIPAAIVQKYNSPEWNRKF